MKKLAALILTIPLALTACGAAEWSDEEKLMAWDKQQCRDLSRLDGNQVARSASIDLITETSLSRADQTEAMDTIDRLTRSDTAGDVIDPDGDLTCEGWVWENHRNNAIPEDFTQEVAEERGLY